MFYKVNGEVFETIDDVLDYCIEDGYHTRDDDYFETWVNDTYDYAEIAGNRYKPYDILDNFGDLYCAEEEYQEIMNSDDRYNAKYELERASDGDEVECQQYTIYVCAEGDYDGDEPFDTTTAIEELRRRYDEARELARIEQAEQETTEKDVMSLFQHIGA